MITLALAMAFLTLPLAAIAFRLLHSPGGANEIRQLILHIAAGAVIFAVATPLIGFAMFVIFYEAFISSGPESFFSSLSFWLLIGYFISGIPALLRGMVAGALKPWLKSWWNFAGIGFVNLLLTLLWSGAISNPFGLNFRMSIFWITAESLATAIPGAVACIFSARILCGRTRSLAPV